jgi:hypothetical protein
MTDVSASSEPWVERAVDARAAAVEDDLTVVKENLWQFCRTALGAPRA